MEDAVEQMQPLYAVHGGAGHAQALEIVDNIHLNAFQPGLGCFDAVFNYQLSQNEDKTAIFEGWSDFLNYFDSSIRFQLSFLNLSA